MKKILERKNILTLGGILLICILLTVVLIFTNDSKKVNNVVSGYFNLVIEGNYEKSNQYLNSKYEYSDNDYFNQENVKLYLGKYSYKVKKVEIEKDSAIVTIELKHPKLTTILENYVDYLSKNLYNNNKQDEQEFKKEQILNKDLEYETDSIQILLKKKQNNWEIINDSNLKLILTNGKSAKLENDSLSDNERKQQEYQKYITDNLELKNYKVGYSTKYTDDKVPSISNIEVKNNGDKEITELELKIDFLDDNGNITSSRTVTVISNLSKSLKAGYSWKLEDDKFYELKNIDNSINIEKSNVKILNIKFGTSKETAISDEQKYINEYMEIVSYRVKKYEKFTGELLPGLGELSIKNKGGKDLKRVEVTVYFQDENGNNIAENNLLVIGGLFSDPSTLKSNYSWKMESDKFYQLENLASEVDLSKNSIKITDITFDE